MGRDVLRAVGRFTDHLEPSEATVGTAGWAGAIFGGLGLASAAGLYYASRRTAEPGRPAQQGTGYSANSIPDASQSAPETGRPAQEDPVYFAIPDGTPDVGPVSEIQKSGIARLLSDQGLNATGRLTRASAGAGKGVFRWRGDKAAWLVPHELLSNPEKVVVRTDGARAADPNTLQVIDIKKARTELPAHVLGHPDDASLAQSPHFTAASYAILADSTAQKALAYWADATHAANVAQLSRALWGAGFLYTGKERQGAVFRESSSVGGLGGARTIVEPLSGFGRSWFEAMFGFSDHTPESLEHRDKFEYDEKTGKLTLRSDGSTWQAGRFSLPTLKELRKKTETNRNANKTSQKPLRFVTGDVAVLHGDPKYNNAVFQAASQFNCLDGETPEKGVSSYSERGTQGAACAISCAAGTIVRTYFARYGQPQTAANQINTIEGLIEKLGGTVRVENGYAFPKASGPGTPNINIPQQKEEWEGLTGEVRVGVQQDTEVTCTKRGEKGEWVRADAGNRVTQVYAGAVSVPNDLAKKQEWTRFARLVLRAAYEATLHVALDVGARTVVLTALSWNRLGKEDGDKANWSNWIAEAIGEAVVRFKNAGLDIVINCKDETESQTIRSKLKNDGISVSFGAWPRPIQMYTE
jgi:hypothetical protein